MVPQKTKFTMDCANLKECMERKTIKFEVSLIKSTDLKQYQ